MTFTVGDHVRVKPSPERPHSPIGTVVNPDVDGDGLFTEVEYRRRLGESETLKTTTGRLEEMCKEHVYRSGFASSSECGRRAKEGHLCGMHLSNKQRRQKERDAAAELARQREQKRAEEEARRKELEAKIREQGWHEFVGVADANAGLVRLRWDDLIDLVRNA